MARRVVASTSPILCRKTRQLGPTMRFPDILCFLASRRLESVWINILAHAMHKGDVWASSRPFGLHLNNSLLNDRWKLILDDHGPC